MSGKEERKVLKEILPKIKAKAINSRKVQLDRMKYSSDLVLDSFKALNDYVSEHQEDQMVKKVSDSLKLIHSSLMATFQNVFVTLDDYDLYIEILERLSSELDKTLTEIFDRAFQIAEEQRKNIPDINYIS
jgi:hypothetical protein